MRAFNAFQITGFFAAFPFLVGWPARNPFAYAGAAFWLSLVIYLVFYLVFYLIIAGAVYQALKDAL